MGTQLGSAASRVSRRWHVQLLPYGIALGCTLAALLVRAALDPVLGNDVPFATFYLAVLVSAWLGGLSSGLFAMITGYIAADWFFSSPREALNILHPTLTQLVSAVVYITVGLAVCGLVHRLRRLRESADASADVARRRGEELEALFSVAPVGLAVAGDPDCRVIHGNEALAKMLGVRADLNISKSSADAEQLPFKVIKGDRELRADELPMQRSVAQGEPVRMDEFEIVRADGSRVMVLGDATPLRDGAGRTRGSVGIFVDVTAMRLAQEELHNSEARLRAVVASAGDAVLTIDESQRITFFNDTAEKIFRCSRDEALGSSLERFIPAQFRPIHTVHVQGFAATGATARAMGGAGRVLPALRANGDEFLMEAQISQTIVAGEKLLTVILRDVTERYKAEEELRCRAAQQAAVAELGEVALAAPDIDGFLDSVVAVVAHTLEIEFAAVWELNPASNDLRLRAGLGWGDGVVGHAVLPASLDSLAGYTLRIESAATVTVEDLEKETRFSTPAVLRSHGIVSGSTVVIPGEVRPFGILAVYATKRRVFAAQEASFLQTVANLITAALLRSDAIAREREARKHAEAANQAKDLFLATVSHELRTPLSPILAWSSMLKDDRLDDAQRRRAVEVIERSARSQAQIIDDLLDISRIVSGRMRLQVRTVKLPEVIDAAVDAVRPAAEAKGIRLNAVVDPDAGPISGDPTRLQQVVWNLVSNAVKFTSRDGRVQVLVERVSSHVEISVADTGQGIAPELLPHIFENFWQADASSTRRHGGLGLGLGIVRRIVELHGGTVLAESAGPGQGSTFTVKLPLMVVRREGVASDPRRHPAAEGTCPPGEDLTNLRVLVVDDEPASNEVVAMLLSACGAEVRVAASASQARTILEHWNADVLISDIGMPDEDGYSLIRSLRASGGALADIPAIALTAFVTVEDRVRVLSSGFQMHVPKPVEAHELLAVVANLARRWGKIPPVVPDEPATVH